MPGLRYYIQFKRLKALNNESQMLGIDLSDLISLKLKRELLEPSEPSKSTFFKLERCELLLNKLGEDLDFVKANLNNFHQKTLE